MSEWKLISPLLDNFVMGDPISSHDGVCCCPAMRKESDEKYIVKIISIPASQTQLDALLLTGAYPDESSALSYFEDVAKDTEKEVQAIQSLSRLEGFLPFEGWQVIKKESSVGYDVYLLSTYKRTLAKHFQKEPMTHLSAINLGLDLCASMAVCRRSGYLYVDLKPTNIFVTADKEYRIGDLGFVRMDSLAYACLPDKYRSDYTAPEMADPLASLNTTVDIYAIGLILYQAYNNGLLPTPDENGVIPPPEYADYEMAEIIMKACAANPTDRWQEPVQMGQALVSYMQRNGANDTPIIPVPVLVADEVVEAVAAAVEADENALADSTENETVTEDSDSGKSPISAVDETPVSEPEETVDEAMLNIEPPIAVSAPEDAQEETVDIANEAEEDDEIALLMGLVEETDPENLPDDIEYSVLSEDLTEMLEQVDEIATYEVPEPVVAPAPIEIVVPEPIVEAVSETDSNSLPEEITLPEDFEPLDSESEVFTASDDETSDGEDEAVVSVVKKKSYNWLVALLVALALLAVVAAGFLYYRFFYLLPVNSIQLEGTEDTLTVLVDAEDESLLKVVCSDSHGNQITLPVVNGKATFENLVPNTAYNIRVIVDGFHRLTGDTATAYSTPAQTNIVQFNAVTGSEDGSVILGFTVEGPDDEQWSVSYSAPGEAEQIVTLSSHMITLTGLTVGKEYTFTLVPASDLYVTGNNEIKFTASDLIYAEDLLITSFVDGNLSVSWNAPTDHQVANWTVRCYNDSDYNETIITPETSITFEGLNHDQNYTVEVTAAGMSVSQRTFVAKNALTASNFQADISDPNQLVVTWESGSNPPADGWLMQYAIDGSENQISIPCLENSLTIAFPVPGAVYNFTLQDANGNAVLCEPFSYQVTESELFNGYNVSAADMTFRLYKAPNIVYTNTFVPDDSIFLSLNLGKRAGSSDDRISILFVVRSNDGSVINSSATTLKWNDLWTNRQCILAIPYTPEDAGEYTISIYFNSQFVTEQPITIKNAAD